MFKGMGDWMGPASRLGGWGRAIPPLNFTYTVDYGNMYSCSAVVAVHTQPSRKDNTMATSKSVSSIFEAHTKEMQSRAQRARDERDAVKRARRALTPLLKLVAFDDTKNNSASLDYNAYNDRISVRLYMYDVEGFKCDEVSARLWALENWKTITKQSVSEYPSALNRTFHYRYEDGTTVSFDVYVKNDSQTCRKVVIGERAEIIKDYAIQCD